MFLLCVFSLFSYVWKGSYKSTSFLFVLYLFYLLLIFFINYPLNYWLPRIEPRLISNLLNDHWKWFPGINRKLLETSLLHVHRHRWQIPSWHLLSRSQRQKPQNNVESTFKVNSENTNATPMVLFRCLYCFKYFTHCSVISISAFEQVNVSWVGWSH